jgi:uncharacterized lipoprotein YajG
MNKRVKCVLSVALYILFGAAAFLPSGCTLFPEHVDLSYTPQTEVANIAAANKVSLRVEVKDARPSSDIAYLVDPLYGEMAPIIPNNDILGLVRYAVETELKARGFKVGSSSALVSVELSNYRNHFHNGFFSGTAIADCAMNVKVASTKGNILYDKHIMAQGMNPSILLSGGPQAKVALDLAMQNAVAKLFSDPEFTTALLAADDADAAANPISKSSLRGWI